MKVEIPPINVFYRKKVDNRLYTGKSTVSPVKLYQMKKGGITQIIDLRKDSAVQKTIERIICAIYGIKYRNLKVNTETSEIPPLEFFNKVNELIVKNKGETYMHCRYGRHRTGMCVAAYEHDVLKKDTGNIIDELANNFADVLGNYSEKHLKQKLSIVFNKFAKKYKLDHKSIAVF